jgi:amino acid adenylation domain-containing protein
MNPDVSSQLSRRFIELPKEKRRAFLEQALASGIDLSLLPIPPGIAAAEGSPASYAQRRMWFLWKLEPESAAYHISGAIRLRGPLDAAALATAFGWLCERHDSLRTTFVQEADQVIQRVAASASVSIVYDDLRHLDEDARNAAVDALSITESAGAFDLQAGPLFRVRLTRIAEDVHLLRLTIHHIVSDGWSMNLLLDELATLYDVALAGGEAARREAAPAVRYSDYAIWQQAWLEAGEGERQLAYWKAKLGDGEHELAIGTDRPRPDKSTRRGDGVDFALDPDVTRRLKALSIEQKTTLFTVVASGFALFLYRYTGCPDPHIGAAFAGRERTELQRMIGLFVNMQVLRTQLAPEWSFRRVVAEMRNAVSEAQAHQDLPFDWLVQSMRLHRSMSRNPLFQVSYAHETLLQSMRSSGNLNWQILASDSRVCRFDLELTTREDTDGTLRAHLRYATDLFDRSTIEACASHFRRLLEAVVDAPDRAIGTVELLSTEERRHLLGLATNPTVPGDTRDVVGRIELQAARCADAVALVFGDETVSYAELNRRANRLARRLRRHGVGPDVLVALAVERSAEMVMALLAVLKAGGAYVPLDPDYPAQRLAHMLRDSGARLVLTQERLLEPVLAAAGSAVEAWSVDEAERAAADEDGGNLGLRVHPDSLAYVIYTSGSTGTPKGVMIRHGALVNFLATMADRPGISERDRVLALTSLSFDIAGLEVFLPLISGARVVLADRASARDPVRLKAVAAANGATIMQATPATWRMLADHGGPLLPAGCRVLCGGEALAPDLARRLIAAAGSVWNLYGPTETTIWSARHRLDANDDRPALGSPIGHTSLHILDGDLNLVPVGVVGELYIGGAGLARGYFRRAGLTGERFVPDPFGEGGGRLYRTGDLARRRADGVVEYVGRADDQVKIRGFRIEPGEIEARLLEAEGVRSAVVVARDAASGPQLVGYITGEGVNGSALRSTLSHVLPDYMVPARIMVLDRLPLTPNGKVDRRALPDPQGTDAAEHVAPRTAPETALAAIWSELLRRPTVGVTDNFFELGGDSIISLQVVSRARAAGLLIEPRDVFRHQTLQELALAARMESVQQAVVDAHDAAGVTPPNFALSGLSEEELDGLGLDWGEVEDIYPLSPMQQGMLFHALKDGGSGTYVNQAGVEIRGLDASRLRSAWQAVSDRHAVLRTGFVWRELSGLAQQVVYRRVDVPFTEEDWRARASRLDAAALDAALAEAGVAERLRGFDLSRPPLQRLRLIRLGDDRHWLIWTYHHILLDGWSLARVVGEVLRHEGGEALPAVQGRYRDYIAWLAGRDRAASETFWRGTLSALSEPTFLADALGRTDTDDSGHGSLALLLDANLTGRLQAFARRERVTLNTLVQGAWAQLLRQHTNQSVVSFGATVAGRPAELAGSEEIVGLFINTLPVVDGASPRTKVGAWLRELQGRNLNLREHDWTPLYEVQRLAGRPGRPLFDTILVFENYPVDQALKQKGHRVTIGRTRLIETSNYPLFVMVALGERLNLVFNYHRGQFDEPQVRRLQAAFVRVLEALSADAERPLGAIDTQDPAERALLERVNATFGGEAGRDVITRIELQAARRADAVALVFGHEEISYAELNHRVNRLARRLRAHGVGPDVLVALAVERSVGMVVSLLAVLKAGGAYVPLDPDYPAQRLSHMLRDSGARLVLTQGRLLGRLDPVLTGIEAWRLDAAETAAANEDEANLGVRVHPDNLAYVIYTSGSTGTPKGVMVRHGALASFLTTMADRPGISDRDRVLALTSLSFDIAGLELFLPLTTGARIVLADRAAAHDPARLKTIVAAQGVTMIQATPATWRMLTDHGGPLLPAGCRVLCGGEALAPDLARRLVAAAGSIWNLYGPTETTIWSARHRLDADDDRPVLGGPIGRTTLHILDGDLNPAPVGVVGELYIGGAGLARGYWGRAGLSGERFVPDPFGSEGGARLYRTGDLARWRFDGVVEYVGRADDQVKIRGFRIEPGEIEARLLEAEGVRSAVVVARKLGSGRQLIGYVTGEGLDSAVLRSALSEVLPDYMVPTRIVVLDRLPLTPNGKVDRRALPDAQAADAGEHVEPRTATEAALAAIWSALLARPTIGITDNFFELGGDSLIAVQVANRIKRDFGHELSLREFFEAPTVEAVATVLDLGALADRRVGDIAAMLDTLKEVEFADE